MAFLKLYYWPEVNLITMQFMLYDVACDSCSLPVPVLQVVL